MNKVGDFLLEINKIYNMDCLKGLKQLPDSSIDMCITSPPYWGLRNYETNFQIWDGDINCNHEWSSFIRKGISGGTKSEKVNIKDKDNFQIVPDTQQSFCVKCGAWKGELGLEPTFDLYIKHLCDIFDEVKRVLKLDGTCWVNLGDTYAGSGKGAWKNKDKQKEVYVPNKKPKLIENIPRKSLCCIPDRFKIEMVNRSWICRNEIIWHKPNQMPTSTKDRFTVDYEKLFFFTKNEKYYFEQQHEPSSFDNSEKGRNKRTVWSINTKPLKDAHFAAFPPDLVEIPIKAGCPENGIVMDIFMGSGTTALVAKRLNRNYIGFELNPEYCKIAENRISNG